MRYLKAFNFPVRALFCALLPVGGLLPAQEITGTIRGTVLDGSGAPIAGATVIILNSGTGIQTRKVVTNGSGEYVAPLLPVGTYEIDAESAGFKRYSERGVVVNVSDRLEKNLKLSVGESSQTVEVWSSQLAVQTENANAGKSRHAGRVRQHLRQDHIHPRSAHSAGSGQDQLLASKSSSLASRPWECSIR